MSQEEIENSAVVLKDLTKVSAGCKIGLKKGSVKFFKYFELNYANEKQNVKV